MCHEAAARADAPPPAVGNGAAAVDAAAASNGPAPGRAAASVVQHEEWPLPAPGTGVLATSLFGASYNSEGFEEQVHLGAQMALYRSNDDAFRDNFVFIGTNPRINPTSTRIGPSIEIQPMSAFNLRMDVELARYFGEFSALQSFASPLSDFGAKARARNDELGRAYATQGIRFSISPFVQFKVGPIAVRNQLVLEYFSIDLRGKDVAFYEPALDTLAPGNGKFLSNDLDLFYVKDLPGGGFWSHGRLAAGVRYSAYKPLWSDSDFLPGEDRSKEKDEIHRVGPLVALTLFDDGFSKFHEPTIVAMAQWYAAHPNRTGKDSDQAVPYLVLAFLFCSDLWTSGRDRP